MGPGFEWRGWGLGSNGGGGVWEVAEVVCKHMEQNKWINRNRELTDASNEAIKKRFRKNFVIWICNCFSESEIVIFRNSVVHGIQI